MTNPISFNARTARHGFPTLVAGQAQKEFYVNEALGRMDALLHPAVEGHAASPPASPQAGECWIVAASATGDWLGHDDKIAAWDGVQWTFCEPVAGMQVHAKSSASVRVYIGGWQAAQMPQAAAGGSTIDAEVRTALDALLQQLSALGILTEE